MQVKMLRDWTSNRKGSTVEITGGVADVLIRRGWAEAVIEKPKPKPKAKRKKPNGA